MFLLKKQIVSVIIFFIKPDCVRDVYLR